jgi:hypothetical protein
MSSDGKPGKSTSFVQRIKQKLIDELIVVSDQSAEGCSDNGSRREK